MVEHPNARDVLELKKMQSGYEEDYTCHSFVKVDIMCLVDPLARQTIHFMTGEQSELNPDLH